MGKSKSIAQCGGESKKVKKCKEKKLNPKQIRAIELLAFQGLSQVEVSKIIGVTEKTISNWINYNEKFKEEFNKQVDIAMKIKVRSFKKEISKAVDTIIDLTQNAENETVRLNAAKEIIGYSFKDLSINNEIEREKLKAEILKNQALEKSLNLNDEERVKFSGIPASMVLSGYVDIIRDIENRKYHHFWFEGGRGSWKSSFCSLQVIAEIERNPNACAMVMRQVAHTLQNSVCGQINWAISMLGLEDDYRYTPSKNEITKISTGQKIFFRGASDPSQLKSTKPPVNMGINVFWFEELDQFKGMEGLRNVIQSIVRGVDDYIGLYSFNTPKSKHHFVNIEKLTEVENRKVHKSCYLDVPKEWLGEGFLEEAEILKDTNELAYQHEYLGVAIGTGGTVFDNIVEREITDAEINKMDYFYNGLDFGYTDPNVYVRVSYNRDTRILYIVDEIYSIHQKDETMAQEIIKKGYAKDLIMCDSSNPKGILNLNDYGVVAKGVSKFPMSVEIGIDWLKSIKAIVIDKKRTPNTLREFTMYELEQDKHGNFYSQYPDKNNHTIDSVRYALQRYILERRERVKK